MLCAANKNQISTIQVRRAASVRDVESAYLIRWKGYRRYFQSPLEAVDDLDRADNAVLLLATRPNGFPIGTLRILDGRRGSIEFGSMLDMHKVLPAERFPVAEAGRFSVPLCGDSSWIKLALWKAYYRYCVDTGIRTMLVTVRRNAGRDYRRLLFDNLGEAGQFEHRILARRVHETWVFDVPSGAERYKRVKHPLYEFFCEEEHPRISYA